MSRKGNTGLTKRAGKLSEDKVEHVITIMKSPYLYKIADNFLEINRRTRMVNRVRVWKII